MTSAASWRMQGDILESCSCNITCPCNYGGDPTELPCEAVLGFRIQEGNYGNTSLGNLNFVIYAQIPGKVFDGGWTLGVFLDERASQEQVEALVTFRSTKRDDNATIGEKGQLGRHTFNFVCSVETIN